MITKVISLKDYRKNITSLWKEARASNICYIVLFHANPILEVKPYLENELIFEDSFVNNNNKDYYKTLEQNMDYWNDERDDNIFLTD